MQKKRKQLGIASLASYPQWARGPARIVDNEVVLDERRAEPYRLFADTEFAFDFVEILDDWQNPDPRRILSFVRRFGLLRHGAEKLGTGECRETLESWWEEARKLAWVMDLHIRLKESIKTGSAAPVRAASLDPAALLKEHTEEDAHRFMQQVSAILAEIMSVKLEAEGCTLGVGSAVLIDGGEDNAGAFLLSYNPPNLVAAAYAQFAMLMIHRKAIAECPGCRRMFAPESGKQKYCTKSCASTSRWRRWNERQTSESKD